MDRLRRLARWTNLRSAIAAACLLATAGCQQEQGEYFGATEPPPGNAFRFNNGAEPEYLDPNMMTGQPDGRAARLLFEGLTNTEPPSLTVKPGAAERWEISPDRRTYTFYLRRDGAWSDGRPLTAHDFVFSWTRVLDPQTGSRYAGHLYRILNGQEFNEGKVKDPAQLGVRAVDDYTLEVRLVEPVPYFLQLTAYYTFFPIPAHVVKKFGTAWTEVSHIAGNGPFLLVEHHPNARLEFARNPRYWNAANVRLERVIAYSVDNNYTSANMYKAGMVDMLPSNYFPVEYLPYLRAQFRDMKSFPILASYYYNYNVTRPPLDNPLVRRALALAVDRRAITDELMRGGQVPASHMVPLGFAEYPYPKGPDFDPQEAARLLAEAGYPNGAGFPPVEILFNTLDMHHKIAQAIQQMWVTHLNIRVTLRNEEWASYLKSMNNLEFDLLRRGWIADYPDPSTFNELFESTSGNNNTGWKNPEYDRLLGLARREADPLERLRILARSEELFLKELPILPIYTYASNYLVKPYVKGFQPSPTDELSVEQYWIDYNWRANGNGEAAARE